MSYVPSKFCYFFINPQIVIKMNEFIKLIVNNAVNR